MSRYHDAKKCLQFGLRSLSRAFDPKADTKLQMDTTPLSANNLATSPTRRMFSSRSAGVKPRFLFKPVRMLSPSRP